MELPASELLTILAAGEGKTTEFKRGLQRDVTLARTLAAFANTRGGLLLVGVGDRGEILGAPKPSATLGRLTLIATQQVVPPLQVELATVRVHERTIVVCSVPLSPARPHAALDEKGVGTVFVRVGSSNRAARPEAIAAMVQRPRDEVGDLERRVLAWIETQRAPEVEATVAEFARSSGVGIQRCRRAFLVLEQAGLLVGHGRADQRVFARPR